MLVLRLTEMAKTHLWNFFSSLLTFQQQHFAWLSASHCLCKLGNHRPQLTKSVIIVLHPLKDVGVASIFFLLPVKNNERISKPQETDKFMAEENPPPHAFLTSQFFFYILCQLDMHGCEGEEVMVDYNFKMVGLGSAWSVWYGIAYWSVQTVECTTQAIIMCYCT